MAQPAPIIPLAAKKARLQRLTNGEPAKVVVGTTTNTDATLSALSSMAGVAIGAVAAGAGIVVGTTVIGIDDVAHTAELSAAANATNEAKYITFTNPANPGPLKFRFGKVARVLDDAVVLGDLTPEECDLTDYPAGGYTITYTPGYITEERIPSNESQMIQLIVATAVPKNTLYYWWIDDGIKVWMCAPFTVPVPMARVGAAIKATVEDSYPPGLPILLALRAARP